MSAFTLIAPQFDAFLDHAKDDTTLAPRGYGALQNVRFIPRNFLLEERLDPSRVANYAAVLSPTGPATFAEWGSAHNEYLKRYVFRRPPVTHNYREVDRDNPGICPETFSADMALLEFQGTDLDTYLIRLVSVADIAWMSRREKEVDDIFSLGQQVAAAPDKDTPERQALSQILDEAYNITNDRCEHRPIFAAFYEDFKDNELSNPADTSWANRLRDRLGLYHISQLDSYGLPRHVFLFRYTVRKLPRYLGGGGLRPLAVPVVIDHKFSVAFCPAPHELDRGRMMNLEAGAMEEPAREVLHLFMPMQAEHLFRVASVTTRVAEDLAAARRDHLIWMQLQGRDSYASSTDADLLT